MVTLLGLEWNLWWKYQKSTLGFSTSLISYVCVCVIPMLLSCLYILLACCLIVCSISFQFYFLKFIWIVCIKAILFLTLSNVTSHFLDGNGFKTSTMRLGADAIVFSRAVNSRYIFILYILVYNWMLFVFIIFLIGITCFII